MFLRDSTRPQQLEGMQPVRGTWGEATLVISAYTSGAAGGVSSQSSLHLEGRASNSALARGVEVGQRFGTGSSNRAGKSAQVPMRQRLWGSAPLIYLRGLYFRFPTCEKVNIERQSHGFDRRKCLGNRQQSICMDFLMHFHVSADMRR